MPKVVYVQHDETERSVEVDELRAEQSRLPKGPYLLISVGDTGHGMDTSTIERIFEPFFTTKPVGQGTGLGLSVVHGIVQKHGGAITVESRKGVGSVFQVYLPAAHHMEDESHGLTGRPPGGAGQQLLFVDDEQQITYFAKRILAKNGYRIVVCNDPSEALARFKRSPDDFAAVMTDLTMPGMSGVELGSEILRTRPGIPIILCSGFASDMDTTRAKEQGFHSVLMKPFSSSNLLAALQKVFGS